jgi:hypothetical protein
MYGAIGRKVRARDYEGFTSKKMIPKKGAK